MSKYRSFASTVSLLNRNIDGDVKDFIVNWLSNKTHAYGVLETDKSGKLHAHFQIWLEEATTKDSAFKRFNGGIHKLCPDSIIRHACKHKIAYSDGYLDYCEKDIQEVLINNPPPHTEYFYPTQQEQDKAKAKTNAKDFYFHHLNELLDDHYSEIELNHVYPIITHKEIATALYELMFDKKLISVIVDDKRRRNVAKCLFHYRFPHYSPEFCMTTEEYESYRTFSKISN